jgi:hypothetical protein
MKSRRSRSTEEACHDELRKLLHPNLREQFVPLPATQDELTQEQVECVFKGDESVLKDLMQVLNSFQNCNIAE